MNTVAIIIITTTTSGTTLNRGAAPGSICRGIAIQKKFAIRVRGMVRGRGRGRVKVVVMVMIEELTQGSPDNPLLVVKGAPEDILRQSVRYEADGDAEI